MNQHHNYYRRHRSDSDDDGNDIDLELELDSFVDDPDAPLAMASSPTTSMSPSSPQPRPKWLTSGGQHHHRRSSPGRLVAQWGSAAASWLLEAVRPRRSWRYLLCAAVSLYALACLARGVPLLASPLPGYSGDYRVGAVDVEVPLAEPRRVSDVTFKADGKLAFEVETVLFTVYYPVEHDARSSRPKHRWIPKPVGVTAEGYAKLAHMNNFLMRPILTFALWAIGGGITIPAEVDVPLLGTSSPDAKAKGQKFPVMVFSHGMASSRTDYTNYLGELASSGRVVAAIEHRDGSSPGSLIRNTSAKDKKDRKVIAFQFSELQTSPEDPAMDIVRMHTDQLAFRDVEIRETVKVLQRLNDGHGADVFAANARGEGTDFASWVGRLDFDHLTIGGHSYGATGALQALKGAPSAENPAIGGVILDPGKSSGPLNHDVDVPVLIVHSNSWSSSVSVFYGRPHFDTVRDLARSVLRRSASGASWFLTSLGTSHPSVTDAPLLEPLLLSWTTGASADVKEALKEYVRVTRDFFNFLEKGKATGVLDEEVTHDSYKHWVSDERAKSYPPELAKFWEIHISPRGPNGEDSEKDKEETQ